MNDGVLNVNDVDTVMSQGLGMRYAFLGPLETAHLNAEGMYAISRYMSLKFVTSMMIIFKILKYIILIKKI